MRRTLTWLQEIAQFLKLRVTGMLFGALLCGSVSEATFVHPSLIERIVTITSAFVIGWFLCHRYYEAVIEHGESMNRDEL